MQGTINYTEKDFAAKEAAVNIIMQHFADYYNGLDYYRNKPALLRQTLDQYLLVSRIFVATHLHVIKLHGMAWFKKQVENETDWFQTGFDESDCTSAFNTINLI